MKHTHHDPDFNQLLKVLRREKPDRPTLFEFLIMGPVYDKLLGEPVHAEDAPDIAKLGQCIKAYGNGGYDFAAVHSWEFDFISFPAGGHASLESRSLNEGAVISDPASFEAYAWQDVNPVAYTVLGQAAEILPRGMKLIAMGPGGVEENMIELVGFQDLCFMQMDTPGLVRQIADAIGSRLLAHYEEALKYDAVGAIIVNDDWGFKTQTMMPPAFLREYIVPWHRRFAAAAHAAGRPVIMHCCGQLSEVMDDIIDDIKVDGKHSYEDGITPVEEFYEEYGDRIAILGGIDMDYLCRKTPEEIYERCAALIEQTNGCKGYALGSGNSIADYVPVENYEAMTRAALEAR